MLPPSHHFARPRTAFSTPMLVAGALAAASAAEARTWRVAPDGHGDAPTIQAGLDSAQAGDVVVLAPGTYTWTSEGASGSSMLRIRPAVALRGEAGAAATILDGESKGRLLRCTDVGDGVSIEDLTFTNGLAPPERIPAANRAGGRPDLGERSRDHVASLETIVLAPDDSHGGAIDVLGASQPTIRRCVFIANQAIGGSARGGAIYCDRATIEACDFSANQSGVSGPTNGRGGAIWCGDARIRQCTFRDNRAWGWEAASGGAVRSVSATVTDCAFERNSALCPGGPTGGAIADTGNPTIERCVFRGNHVDAHYFFGDGGALEAGSGNVTDCLFVQNVARCKAAAGRGGGLSGSSFTATRCVFIGNAALRTDPLGPGHGGAIFSWFPSTIENCTLVGNSGGTADGVGGIALEEGGTLRSVLVTHTEGRVCSGDAIWSCCDLFANAVSNSPCGTDGGGNFGADPRFCTDPTVTADVSIHADSPCAAGKDPGSCALIGAGGVACEIQAIQSRTWTAVKQLYRPERR